MSIISLDTAKTHLRAGDGDDGLIQLYIDAAEDMAAQFINRSIFADGPARDQARAVAAAGLAGQLDVNAASTDTANAIIDPDQRGEAISVAENERTAILWGYRAVMGGIVINPSITAACLLTIGKLYANREDMVTGQTAVELPNGARALLHPYRVGLGV